MVIERSPHPLRHALPLFLVAGFCLSSLDATAKYLVRDHSLLGRRLGALRGPDGRRHAVRLASRGPRLLAHPQAGLQLLRSLFLVLATLGFWGGLRYLPLAEASSITFLAPTFVVAALVAAAARARDRARGKSRRRSASSAS